MATDPAKNNKPITLAADKGSVSFYMDEFTIPSLVEAQLRGLPLTDDENRLFEHIQHDEQLRQEYYGLLAVMNTLERQPSPSPTSFYYLLEDTNHKLHKVEDKQVGRRLYLLEGGARIIGVEQAIQNRLPAQAQALPELGVVLDFSQARQARLIAHSAGLAQVAESGVAYQYQPQPASNLNLADWRLEYETTQGQHMIVNFNQDGLAQLPADFNHLLFWRLLYYG